MAKISFNDISSVYGFPTTGKTTFIESIKKNRFLRITDTDLLFPAIRDNWFDLEFYHHKNSADKEHDKKVGLDITRIAMYMVQTKKTDILISNLWFTQMKLDIGFIRTNVDDIVHLSKIREGAEFPKDMVERWVSGLTPKRVLSITKGYVDLQKDEFIGTFLKFDEANKRIYFSGDPSRIITEVSNG